MKKKKILFISQEITPYLPETEMSIIGRYLPQEIQEKGKEIRLFMPKFGVINERRNQLHEVIRLSGMNIIIDDTDHPLIIKVASIQSARMQVYFIDNEEFFVRKRTLSDPKGKIFEDNDERGIFFARGVLETVRKLRWSPDLIHCHGWFTGLVPLFLKKVYSEDPLFSHTKAVFSVYDDHFKGSLNERMKEKLSYGNITAADLIPLAEPDYLSICKLAITHSDGVIIGNPEILPELQEHINKIDKPTLSYQPKETYTDAYSAFYDKILT